MSLSRQPSAGFGPSEPSSCPCCSHPIDLDLDVWRCDGDCHPLEIVDAWQPIGAVVEEVAA
jgi:hypothetical protein